MGFTRLGQGNRYCAMNPGGGASSTNACAHQQTRVVRVCLQDPFYFGKPVKDAKMFVKGTDCFNRGQAKPYVVLSDEGFIAVADFLRHTRLASFRSRAHREQSPHSHCTKQPLWPRS